MSCPTLTFVTLARKTTFDNLITSKTEDFFESLNNLGLGFSFGIIKGSRVAACAPRSWPSPSLRRPPAGPDLAALCHLFEARTADYQALKEEIQSALKLLTVRFEAALRNQTGGNLCRCRIPTYFNKPYRLLKDSVDDITKKEIAASLKNLASDVVQ